MATRADRAAGVAGKTTSSVRSGRGSKKKGSDYERALAEYLNQACGLDCRRALLSGGGRNDGGADLDHTPLIHVEAKRVESVSPYTHIRQAEVAVGKARDKSVKPVVITRRNNMATGQSLVIMRLDDWMAFYKAALAQKANTFDIAAVNPGKEPILTASAPSAADPTANHTGLA